MLANAAAGRGGSRAKFDRAVRLCRDAGAEVVLTASAAEAEQRARQAVAAGRGRVIAAGGDGTAHFILNALAGTGTAFGVIPIGSGNDIARELAIPADIEAATHAALTAPARAVDLGRAGARYFLSIASFGLDSYANDLANRTHALTGRPLYLYAALRAIAEFRQPDIRLDSDGGSFHGRMVLAAVANGSHYGGGMRIAPRAEIADGQLDVCIVRGMSRFRMLRYFPEVFSGRHLRRPEVEYFRATRISVEADRPLPLFLDGEHAGSTPVEFEVCPAALHVIMGTA